MSPSGRRLGYPLKLVEAKDHLYCRWDDIFGQSFPPERFNIEGAGQGFGMYPDSHYENWPRKAADFERQAGVYGRPLTSREELAGFVTTRGHCLLDNGRREEAIQCFRWSVELAPHDVRYKMQLESILDPGRGRYHIPTHNAQPNPSRDKRPPGKLVKVAFGRLPPADLPPGTPIKYVPEGELDPAPGWQPEPGRVYKIAAGQPPPAWLPFGTPMQVVPPDQADDFAAIKRAAAIASRFPKVGQPLQPVFAHHQHIPGIHDGGGGKPFLSLPEY
jgi:hypothetical protein